MTHAARGRPGRQLGRFKEKTITAQLTKQRIHAIVGQVIDELEKRRAKGKSDYVANLADEIEKGGIAAWKSLMDLLPPDDVQPATDSAQFNFGSVFAAAVKQMSERQSAAGAPAIEGPGLPIIDLTATEIQAETVKHEPAGQQQTDW
jgi:hypothetical protein